MTGEKIKGIITYAYGNVPYYNQIINDNDINIDKIDSHKTLSLFPIFTKDTIKKYGWVNFVAQEYLDERHDLIKRLDIRIEKTSGTTQEPMDIPWLCKDYYSSVLNHWKFRQKNFGISPECKMCIDYRNKMSELPYSIKNNKIIINTLNLSKRDILSSLEGICRFKPEWMYIQPSLLLILVKTAKEERISFPDTIKYIEYEGEPLLPYYRKIIEEYIQVKTANMYGCAETNGIAYECRNGKLHLLEENVITEIVCNSENLGYGKQGNVCVTGLHNRIMPMIRYKLNDQAVLYPGDICACGNKSPVLELLATRLPEFLLFEEINHCSYGLLFYPVNQMKFIEKKPSDIVFTMKLNNLMSYDITFFTESRINEGALNIEALFSKIMSGYGLSHIKFNFGYSTESYDKDRIGILRYSE